MSRTGAPADPALSSAHLAGLTALDIGSGNGLSSLVARRLGATVTSFDYDPSSVACTSELRRRYFPDDQAWWVQQASARAGAGGGSSGSTAPGQCGGALVTAVAVPWWVLRNLAADLVWRRDPTRRTGSTGGDGACRSPMTGSPG